MVEEEWGAELISDAELQWRQAAAAAEGRADRLQEELAEARVKLHEAVAGFDFVTASSEALQDDRDSIATRLMESCARNASFKQAEFDANRRARAFEAQLAEAVKLLRAAVLACEALGAGDRTDRLVDFEVDADAFLARYDAGQGGGGSDV